MHTACNVQFENIIRVNTDEQNKKNKKIIL